MKAITLIQPWASLIAAGVKRIETRGRATSYRGRLAIHAGKRTDLGGRCTVADYHRLAEPCAAAGMTCFCGHPAPDHDRTVGCLAGCPCGALRLDWPLGAVVASAVLTDCVPMVQFLSRGPGHEPDPPYTPYHEGRRLPIPLLRINSDRSILALHQPGGIVTDVIDQLPFGDFRPGRWALLLDDIAPVTERCPACWGERFVVCRDHPFETVRSCLDCWGGAPCLVCNGASLGGPVPARGHRAVPWEWTPDQAPGQPWGPTTWAGKRR